MTRDKDPELRQTVLTLVAFHDVESKVDLIERRIADGDDYLDLLTDSFTRELLGEDGYLTALLEICARKVLYENAYWNMLADLRNRGHLDQNGYNQLLDKLHARKLIDDLNYRRWSRRDAPALQDDPLPHVAESAPDYYPKSRLKNGQNDLFD